VRSLEYLIVALFVFLILGFVAFKSYGEVVCPECEGWAVDIAIDADTIGACAPGPYDFNANRLEYEIVFQDGDTFYKEGCSIRMRLRVDEWVHARGRLCNDVECSPYAGWSPKARRLTPCPGDFTLDGTVNADDFKWFRSYYLRGTCE